MAVEKLILRSILYGADKIPDAWFEKLPGGYYRDSHGNKRKIGDKTPKKDDPKTTSGGRKAEVTDFYPERQSTERGRDRRRDRYRGRSTSSYDGGADDDGDYYYYREDGRRPHRSKSRRRRRSEDVDQREHREGHARRRRDDERHDRERYHNDRHRGARSPSRDQDPDRRRSAGYPERSAIDVQPRSSRAGPVSRAAVIEANPPAEISRYPGSNYAAFIADMLPPPPMSRNAPMIETDYVPYAHIYGTARQPAPQQAFSPVAPYPQGYPQTQFDQQVPATQSRSPRNVGQDNVRGTDAPGVQYSNGYDSHDDARRNRSERRNNGSYSKSVQYANPRSQPKPQKPTSTRNHRDRHHSDFDGSYGEAERRSRRLDGYHSE